MALTWIDWGIVVAVISFMVVVAIHTKKYNKSVADYLAAGRCAGRYMLSISEGIAGLGAITIIGGFEMHYRAGFSAVWWSLMMVPITMTIALIGWVIYRFRQTMAMTLSQFLEMRYSRKFRVFAGTLAFVSGIINFGIFPAVGTRFFIHYCSIPEVIPVLGFGIPSYPLIMAVLLALALFFTYIGGQIAVIITDFIQGLFCNFVFIIAVFVVLTLVNWTHIAEVLGSVEHVAKVHPFKGEGGADFTVWYFLIMSFGAFYTYMVWQGTQGYNCSAISPHEAKMGKVLGIWRMQSQGLFILVLSIAAFVFMRHPDFASQAAAVNETIGTIENSRIQEQMTVPIVLGRVLPPSGMLGAVCAVLLVAFISTHDTYLHSWASIFVQDVLIPLRKKPMEPKTHLRLLRLAPVGVAVFIYLFSLLFRQTEYIFMFFQITGAIYFGGAGAVIIGGLYWKKGTVQAAWSAMIVGAVLAVAGIVITQIDPGFPLNGVVLAFIASVMAVLTYIVVSLLGKKTFNLDRMLHRGQYADQGEKASGQTEEPVRGWKVFRMGKEFTRGDKIIYILSYAYIVFFFGSFVIGTVYNLVYDVSVESWLKVWHIYIWVMLALSVVITVWLLIGGLRDAKRMFTLLRTRPRDEKDDGWVSEPE